MLENLLLLVLALFFALTGVVPAWKTLNSDFPNYYLAAKLYRAHVPLDRAYEWEWFQRQKDHYEIDQPLVGFAPHPPLCALPFLPLATLKALTAKRLWIIINLLLLLATILILSRASQLGVRRIAILALLCVTPLRNNFMLGQYYVLILFLVALSYSQHRRGRSFSSGLLLAIAAALKLFPAGFVLIYMREKNWKGLSGFFLGVFGCGVTSVGIFGWEVHRVFLTEVLPRAMNGDLLAPYSSQWSSFSALFHRWFLFEPELNPHPWMQSHLLYAASKAFVAVFLIFTFWWTFDRD
jgi:hypothetical protein